MKYFFTPLLIPFLLSFHYIAYAADTCPELDTPYYSYNNFTLKLGGGSDRDRENIKQMSCLNYSKIFLGSPTSVINNSVTSSFEDVLNKIKVTAGGSVSYMGIFKASTNFLYEKIIHETAFNQSFVLDYDIEFGTLDANLDSNNPLNQTGQSLSGDACGFKKVCGNEYVCQAKSSAGISVKMDFAFTSSYHKKQFNIGAAFEVAKLKIGGGLNAAFEKLSESTRKNTTLRIEAIQYGGRVEQLSRILGGGTVFNCSLDNLNACSRALNIVSEYVSSDDFTSGAREYPKTTNHVYCPYNNIYGVPNMPNEVTEEIKNARQQLVDTYKNLLVDKKKIIDLFGNPLSLQHTQQLETILPVLEDDIDKVKKAGELCLSDLAQCSKKANQVLNQLITYDKKVLTQYFNDGLIAHYPLDGNAKDVVGGHDGNIRGNLTPANNRYGIPGKAFYFDGSSYILIPDTDDFSISNDSLTYSTWVTITDNRNSYNGFIALGTGGDNLIHLSKSRSGHADGRVYMQPYPAITFSDSSGGALPKNQWMHLVGTVDYENETVSLYINGQFQSRVPTTSLNLTKNQDLELVFGGFTHGEGALHIGLMDEIYIFKRAITSDEVQILHAESTIDLTSPPIAIFIASTVQENAPFTVNLDASKSIDANYYNWQSSDGQSASGKFSSLQFNQPGTYTIMLNTTNTEGITSQAQKTITLGTELSLPPISTTNLCSDVKSINSCRVKYTGDGFNGKLCIPCISILGAFGSQQIFSVEFTQVPNKLQFSVIPGKVFDHDFKDDCLATYSSSGQLYAPCVDVPGYKPYQAYMQSGDNSVFRVTKLK